MVRYLSRRYLEQLAKQHTDRYYQHLGASEMPIPVNPTVLAVETLGLNVQYLPLCQNGDILGLSAFDDVEITLHLEDGSEDHKLLTNRDIVIDTALMADDKIGRCNFTIAHETAHHILCRRFPKEYGPVCNRRSHIMYRRSKEDHSWVEWQADTIASALLLPTELVAACLWVFGLGQRIEMLNSVFRKAEYEKFCNMASYLGVSKQALCIRLKQLGMLGKEYLANPYDLVTIYNDD